MQFININKFIEFKNKKKGFFFVYNSKCVLFETWKGGDILKLNIMLNMK